MIEHLIAKNGLARGEGYGKLHVARRTMAASCLVCSGPMPEISRFLGIVIRMYYRDHPPPHFHAEYGEHEITIEIDSGVVEGRFPRRALGNVLEWYELHQQSLAENWQLAREEQPLREIEPLE